MTEVWLLGVGRTPWEDRMAYSSLQPFNISQLFLKSRIRGLDNVSVVIQGSSLRSTIKNKLLLVAPQLPRCRFSLEFSSLPAALFDQEDARSTLNASRRKQLIQIAKIPNHPRRVAVRKRQPEAVPLGPIERVALAMLIVGVLVVIVPVVISAVDHVRHQPGPDASQWWWFLKASGAIEGVGMMLLFGQGHLPFLKNAVFTSIMKITVGNIPRAYDRR